LIGRNDLNVDEIAIRATDDEAIPRIIDALAARGAGKFARVQKWDDAQPKFIQDIKDTFALLGNIIGSVGVVASSITIFIIVFVSAIVRRRQIGILKAIGVSSNAIELAYVAQALFYAAVGIAIGLAISFLGIKPYVDAHPINFPFSDGVIATTWQSTLARLAALLAATTIAGYLPAKIVVRKNTIDAILGR
jgi:putative ABC transport system permease protein